jgi:hypothetical protein
MGPEGPQSNREKTKDGGDAREDHGGRLRHP